MTGIGLQGYVTAAFHELCAAFGPPNPGDGFKVDAEWRMMTSAGPARIYNYKTGPNYMGANGTPVELMTTWHIGGQRPDVIYEIGAKLREVTGYTHEVQSSRPRPAEPPSGRKFRFE